MGLAKLNELYKQVILENAQHPKHYGDLPQATGKLQLRNPTCGDVINVSVLIDHDQIEDLSFSGSGCTISQASASLMTMALLHQPVSRARELVMAFSHLITGESITSTDEDALGDAALVGSVAEFPARIKCAALAWHAVDEILGQKGADFND
ncbi:MAG: SUF system NifU family Fe-S cluster assembly protein [Lentilactobacillus parabuchneri]|nr:SUF system NifU family Fe-S cluster assembly protein [Lentilactobacillus parabuchneri]